MAIEHKVTDSHIPVARRSGTFGSSPPSTPPGQFEPMHEMFTEADVEGLPAAVRRYFDAAIAPGTPLWASVAITMRGHMRVGRWLPFTATEVLDPHRGFVWRAHVAGPLIVGSDQYRHGQAEMHWKLLGLVPIVHGTAQTWLAAPQGAAAPRASGCRQRCCPATALYGSQTTRRR